jgi:uncharacterized protein (DUF1800 family)
MVNPTHMTPQQARHLLVRSGFAPTQAEVDKLVGKSAQRAVADMVASAMAAKPKYPPPDFVNLKPATPPGQLKTVEEKQEYRRQQMAEGLDIKAWWVREMLETPTPLFERMVLFWHNHFATSQQKVDRSLGMWRQQQLFRNQALGSFGILLHAVARDPAMLVYLDAANSRREAPNENFAREVMELFTLGEASQGGGYNEQDIKEVARAFTGWSVEREDFTFKYRAAAHDVFTKTVLGKTGLMDGDDVLDIMLAQPACAEFIVRKLWKEFVSPAPVPFDVKRIARRFQESNYAISVALTELFSTDTFWAESNRGSLIKSPIDLVVGTVRQFAFSYSDVMPFVLKTSQLGQNLLMPPNVKGWPGHTDWINATTLLERKNFTQQLFRSVELRSSGQPMDMLRLTEQKRNELRTDTRTMTRSEIRETQREELKADMMQGGNSKDNLKSLRLLGRQGVMRVAQSLVTLTFDPDQFLGTYGGYTDREPNEALKATLADVILASNATQNIANGTVGVAYLRTLTLDPAYQLK